MFVWLLAATLSAGLADEWPRVDTSNFLPPIRVQVQQALERARANPRDGKAVGALAMVLHAYQQYDAAAQMYKRARALEPQNFDWVYLLGAAEKAQGAFDAAAESFRSALGIKPGDVAAQLRLAESLSAVADWKRADAAYRRILREHEDLPQAWYGLGRVQAAQGDHQGAIESYGKASTLFPRYGAAHFALAAELRRAGKYAEAEQHIANYSANVTAEPPLADPPFERIHELNRSSIAHLERGAELEKAGEYGQAIREHETALESDPENVQAHVNLIALYGRAGDAAKARLHFEAATRLNPGRSDAWFNYGVLLFRNNDLGGAEAAYRRALDINPSYAEASYNLGIIDEQRGSLKSAAECFRAAISDRPDYSLARFHLARILANEGEYREAISHFLRCLEAESDETPAYLYALGATYARAGDRAHALDYLRKALAAAEAHRQARLQASIERDLKILQAEQ
jgi:tetratricopeptide (TPR) repeat protein